MSATLDRPFKSKQLSPSRQALQDAINSLRVLEAQQATLSASIEYDGKAGKAVLAAQTAIEAAEQALKDAQANQVAAFAGGSDAKQSPRQARDAITRANEDLQDAEHARTQIEREITSLNSQINLARGKRDTCVTAVLAEHYAPKAAGLAAEIAELQTKLVQKAQLLLELAGTIIPRDVVALPQAMERVDQAGQGLAWQIPLAPAALLASYRASVASLKTNAATLLED